MMKNLTQIMDEARERTGASMEDFTVLSRANDPYRLSTDTHRRNADWLAEAIDKIGLKDRIHLRGLHYRLVGSVTLPDGSIYKNDDKTWQFLSEKAAFAARFLGSVNFNLIRDNRNDAPSIWTPKHEEPRTWVTANLGIQIPNVNDLLPKPAISGTLSRQAWRLAIVGEKSSLHDLLAPIARWHEATLALPNGEISTTMTEQIVAAAAADGKPLAVIYLADCDPAGHQMCISFARKAQAIIDLKYPDTRLRVHPVALTPEQAREWNLPSTPLKDTEKRAGRWTAAMGIEQTEIDAAIARAPGALHDVIEAACLEYFDRGLAAREREAAVQWFQEAEASLSEQLGDDMLARLREQLADKLASLRKLVAELSDMARINPDELGVALPPPPEILEGEQRGEGVPSLIDTADGFMVTTQRLRARKAYK